MSSSGKTYPQSPAPSYGYTSSEDNPVSVTRYANNLEQRIALYLRPIKTFTLSYDALTGQELEVFRLFFLDMKGKLRSFVYHDGDDEYDVRFDQNSFEYSLSDWDQYSLSLRLISVRGE